MFILCNGQVAKEPYKIPYGEQNVYSLEELCYYIHHNIYSITEDFFEPSLAEWLQKETGHEKLGEKLETLIANGAKMKDFVVTVFCACDYYKEEEIRSIMEVIDGVENLPLYRKKKIKADNYLRAKRYGKSLLEYRKLLHGSFAVNFTTEEYGNMLHNQGIAHFYTSAFFEAENDFKEAYVRNNKKISLQHYLWLLLIQDKQELFEVEAVSFGLTPAEIAETKRQYELALAQCNIPEDDSMAVEAYKEQLLMAFSG